MQVLELGAGDGRLGDALEVGGVVGEGVQRLRVQLPVGEHHLLR